jgi:hypothetical protein
MVKFRELEINVKKPISIYVDGKEVFMGMASEIKHKFKREEWEEIIDKKYVSSNDFFGTQVFRLESEVKS